MIGVLTTLVLLQFTPYDAPRLDSALQQRGPGTSASGKGQSEGSGSGRFSSGDSSVDSFNVALYANLNLAALGGSGANDIWGYVSPSGREYAMISLLDKLAFVEITNPSSPDFFATIAHPNNGWGDLKVYRDHCYLTTEASGTGVQVIDLSDIDNHVVTLVRTLPVPTDSHNIAIDTESGYMYMLLAHGGTGTTMCFDLSVPSLPVQVGANSMTGGQGQHDAQIVTYTSGPYAGRQILFGASQSLAVNIWDVTDKAAPFQVSTGNYPDTEYCHQCWLSDDRQYLYVNDELDESRNGITTRTLVFDVSDINNPTLVSTFTTGLNSIDHNLYVKCGFIFESNYSSGLRIFDGNDDPENPTEVGWYDTYPANNNANFNGTWSNFPFFPSGTVILSDRQTGLYIFDVSAATVRTTDVAAINIARGFHVSGGLPELETIDDTTLTVQAGITLSNDEAPINVEFTGTALWQHASRMNVSLTGFASTVGLTQDLELYDWDADDYVPIESSAPGTTGQTVLVSVTDPDRFIQDGTMLMKARVRVTQTGIALHWPWSYSFDQFSWQINP